MSIFKRRPDPVDRNTTNDHSRSDRKRSLAAFRRSPSPLDSPIEESANGRPRKHGIFSTRRSSTSDDHDHRRTDTGHSEAGASSNPSSPRRAATTGGFFGGRRGFRKSSTTHAQIVRDPAVVEARQKLHEAEAAEKEADQALLNARTAVKEARHHSARLEMEATEEFMRAKAKQAESKLVAKNMKGLGRHG